MMGVGVGSDLKNFPLRIERMPNGGFVVSEAPMYLGDAGRCWSGPLFASTSIVDALAFIAGRLDPKESDGA